MSISSVSGVNSFQQWNTASPQQQWQRVLQVREDLSQLAFALQSGDLAGARKAYGDLQSLQVSVAGVAIPSDTGGLGQTLAANSLSEALTESALLKGDLASALQNQPGPAAVHGHRAHRHHNGTDQNLPYAAAGAAPSSTGTAIDITA